MTQFAFLYQFKAPIHVSQNVELLRANLKIDSQIVPFKCHVRSFNVETVFQLKYSFWNSFLYLGLHGAAALFSLATVWVLPRFLLRSKHLRRTGASELAVGVSVNT